MCGEGHEWQAKVDNRARGKGCLFCAGNRITPERSLESVCPHLIPEWHGIKNGKLTPAAVTAGSDRKVWWKCSDGHEWRAAISSRKRGSGCPYCAGNQVSSERSLAARNPELIPDWDDLANLPLTPDTVSPGSGKKVAWICLRGHQWQAVIHTRAKGHGCPTCGREKAQKRRAATMAKRRRKKST